MAEPKKARHGLVPLCAGLMLAMGAAAADAATYYVDQTAGKDSNSGTSPSTAWQNAPGMAAYSGSGNLVAGDTVYFDRGDVWVVNGTQGIYLVGGVTYIGNGWGSGTARATLRAGSDIASAVVRFRDHATLPTIFRGFNVDAASKVTNGVEMNHSFYAGPLTGATKRVEDSEIHHNWSRTSLGQYRYGLIVSDAGGKNGEVANVELLNNIVHDTSRDALPIYPGDQSADCIVRNIVVRGNQVYNTGLDPDYGAGAGIIVKGHVIDAVIENNYISKTKGAGIFINSNETNHYGYGPTNIQIRNNIVNVNTGHGSIRLYDGSSGKDPKDVSFYGNIVYNNPSGGGFVISTDLGNTNSVRLYNNTFYNAPVIIDNTAATFPVFEFRNNIVYYPSGTPLTENGKFTAHSNNLYFGSTTLVRAPGAGYTASNIASYEPTASTANPGFTDVQSLPTGFTGTYGSTLAPNTTGLSTAAGSPAIDAGFALATTYRTSINSVQRPAGGGWDIGAYEGTAAALTRPNPPTDVRVLP